MKITFLGTSHGVPEKNRVCSCAMIEVGENIYLIDAGAPVVEEMIKRGIDLARVKGIFITHPHGDHAIGLVHFCAICSWTQKYRSSDFDVFVPEIAILDGVKTMLKSVHCTLREEAIRFSEYQEGTVYDDGTMKLSAIPTKHCEPYPSYAFVVEAEGKRVIFSGDISFHMKGDDMPKCAMEDPGADAFILELAHNEIEHLRPYLERVTAKALYFNHIHPSKMEGVKPEADSFPYPITFLSDGDEILI